jgi:uridylate kinase
MTPKYRRVLLKLSGEALGSDKETINFRAVDDISSEIAKAVNMGVQVGIVVGGGNIWRGRVSSDMDRNRADHMGMLATAINSLAVQSSLLARKVPCKVLSAVPMNTFCETYSSRAANEYLDNGYVVIFACGTGSPFFTTDTAAALRAAETSSDVLMLAKNVDAVYSDDPVSNPKAIRYTHLSFGQVIKENLKATDLTAITLCSEQNIPIILFALKDVNNILNVISGQETGTLID